MNFSIETEAHPGAHNGFVRLYVNAAGERKHIADVFEKPETNEIRLNLADDLGELAEARYARLPLIDLAAPVRNA